MIDSDPWSKTLTILAYIGLVIVFVFAIDFGVYVIAIASLGSLAMLAAGDAIAGKIGATGTISSKPFLSIEFALFALIGFIALDFTVPFIIPVSLSTTATTGAFSVTALYIAMQGIPEEKLFRQGITNLVFRYTRKSVFWTISLSAVIFGLVHIPVYFTDYVTLLIVIGAGMILAYVDFATHRLSTSMIAHVGNNLMSVGYSVITGASIVSPGAVQAVLKMVFRI